MFTSQFLSRPFAAAVFSACDQSPAKLVKYSPKNRFPPVFGMMFKLMPPVSASPRPPDNVNCSSCEPAVSMMYPDTPPPLNAAPTLRPSTCTRPSLPRPPWLVKIVMLGESWVLFCSPALKNAEVLTDGIIARMPL
jgi:hypothetical protein